MNNLLLLGFGGWGGGGGYTMENQQSLLEPKICQMNTTKTSVAYINSPMACK